MRGEGALGPPSSHPKNARTRPTSEESLARLCSLESQQRDVRHLTPCTFVSPRRPSPNRPRPRLTHPVHPRPPHRRKSAAALDLNPASSERSPGRRARAEPLPPITNYDSSQLPSRPRIGVPTDARQQAQMAATPPLSTSATSSSWPPPRTRPSVASPPSSSVSLVRGDRTVVRRGGRGVAPFD